MQWQFPIAMAVYVQLPEGITEYPQFCCFIPSQPVKCPFTRKLMVDRPGKKMCFLYAAKSVKHEYQTLISP